MNSDFRQSMADARNHEGKFGRQKANSKKTEIKSISQENTLKQDETAAGVAAGASLHYIA